MVIKLKGLQIHDYHTHHNSQANVWAKDYLGRQALHLAAQVGTSEVVMLLVKLGADPNQAGSHQMTPLHYAAKVTACLVIFKVTYLFGAYRRAMLT